MSGKVVLVTGGTSGIGEAAAREIARAGATVLVVGRDTDRTKAAVERLRTVTGNHAVFDLAADLLLQSEVRRLVDRVQDRYPTLDVLVNNAGAVYSNRESTSEGLEGTWALNVLAPFLLTRLLEGNLRAAPHARVVNVSSAAHRWGRMGPDGPGPSHRYSAYGAYGRSKLALLLLTYEWARRFEGTSVTVNALHPGFVSTRFGRENPGAFGWGMALAERCFGISPERGARTTVYLATSPEVAGVSGKYFVRSKPRRSSSASYDRDVARRLWTRCGEETGESSADRPDPDRSDRTPR